MDYPYLVDSFSLIIVIIKQLSSIILDNPSTFHLLIISIFFIEKNFADIN